VQLGKNGFLIVDREDEAQRGPGHHGPSLSRALRNRDTKSPSPPPAPPASNQATHRAWLSESNERRDPPRHRGPHAREEMPKRLRVFRQDRGRPRRSARSPKVAEPSGEGHVLLYVRTSDDPGKSLTRDAGIPKVLAENTSLYSLKPEASPSLWNIWTVSSE
jgi:hypothetical protein